MGIHARVERRPDRLRTQLLQRRAVAAGEAGDLRQHRWAMKPPNLPPFASHPTPVSQRLIGMIHTPRSLPAPSRPQPLAVPIIRRWAPLLMAALLSACAAAEDSPASQAAASQGYEKTDRGIVVHPTAEGAADVRLQVVSDRIIRVSADPDGDFKRSPSLMRVEEGAAAPAFEVATTGDGKVRLATAEVVAEVSPDTGRVTFLDKGGKPILSEVPGGRSFAPLKVEGKDYLSVRQRFESPDDEAIYGFGQHQQGWMNQKGRDVELQQNNIDMAVPFLVSSRNYGLLWDNNSITRRSEEHTSELQSPCN